MAHPLRAVVFPLAAPVQVRHHLLARVVAQVSECFAWIAELEVVAPASQVGVEVFNYLGRGFVAFLRSGFLAYRFPCFFQRLLGGHHVQVGFVAPMQVAVIPEGEPEEVKAPGEVQVYHFGLFTVDAQPQPALKLRIEPFVDCGALGILP